MMNHFNGLSPAESERLALLLEEMGEAQQAIGKVLRHGYESRNPHNAGGPSNREALEAELGDVRHAMERLCAAGDLNGNRIAFRASAKRAAVAPYLHHQP